MKQLPNMGKMVVDQYKGKTNVLSLPSFLTFKKSKLSLTPKFKNDFFKSSAEQSKFSKAMCEV